MTITSKLIAPTLVFASLFLTSTRVFARDESYLLQCKSKDKTHLSVKFALEHIESDAITGIREPESTDWTIALNRRVDQLKLSSKKSNLNIELNSENTPLKIDINSNEAVLSKKMGGLEIKLDTNSQICSTNPNKIAKMYHGDLTIKSSHIGAKTTTSVTCSVKRLSGN